MNRAGSERRSLAWLLLKDEVAEFLHEECCMLDERRLREWLELFTEDISYTVPLRRNVKFGEWDRESTSSPRDVMWVADDWRTLQQRVSQMLTGVHWADEPTSRVTHLISNIHIVDCRPDAANVEELDVSCRFIVHRNRLEKDTDIFVGRRTDTLRRRGLNDWAICRRQVILDESVLRAKNLTVFL